MYYENLAYANERLRNTVVQLKSGIPFFIISVDMDGDVNGRWLDSLKQDVVKCKDVDLTPVKLGYMNRESSEDAVYTYRMPIRAWRQGLSADNFTFIGKPAHDGDRLPLKDLYNTIVGNYLPLDYSKGMVRSYHSHAFSRDFCLRKDNALCYHGRIVGTWGNKLKLNKDSLYLAERLIEQVGDVVE